MSYAEIDSTIAAWAEKHKLTLYTHYQGYEGKSDYDFRNVYLSSKHGECCQIWIDKPESGWVSLHAAGVETREDEEMRQDWRVPTSELEDALEVAITFVQSWFER